MHSNSGTSTSDEENQYNEEEMTKVKLTSRILEKIIERVEESGTFEKIRIIQKDGSFNLMNESNISIESYLTRIVKYSQMEISTLVISLIYIDRLCSLGNIYLTIQNIHKILFISIYLSIKYNEDIHFKLDYFALIAGIPKEEIMKLELIFLRGINFQLFVNNDLFNKYKKIFEY